MECRPVWLTTTFMPEQKDNTVRFVVGAVFEDKVGCEYADSIDLVLRQAITKHCFILGISRDVLVTSKPLRLEDKKTVEERIKTQLNARLEPMGAEATAQVEDGSYCEVRDRETGVITTFCYPSFNVVARKNKNKGMTTHTFKVRLVNHNTLGEKDFPARLIIAARYKPKHSDIPDLRAETVRAELELLKATIRVLCYQLKNLSPVITDAKRGLLQSTEMNAANMLQLQEAFKNSGVDALAIATTYELSSLAAALSYTPTASPDDG